MPHCPVATRNPEKPGVASAAGAVSAVTPVNGLFGRYLLAIAGIILVGVGWAGAFLPGLPTVGPLLLASFCFARSCPWLEQRLIRNRFFAPFLQYVDGDRPLPARARIGAITMMWTSVLVSSTFLLSANRSTTTFWVVSLILASGIIGTIAIWRFRRKLCQ